MNVNVDLGAALSAWLGAKHTAAAEASEAERVKILQEQAKQAASKAARANIGQDNLATAMNLRSMREPNPDFAVNKNVSLFGNEPMTTGGDPFRPSTAPTNFTGEMFAVEQPAANKLLGDLGEFNLNPSSSAQARELSSLNSTQDTANKLASARSISQAIQTSPELAGIDNLGYNPEMASSQYRLIADTDAGNFAADASLKNAQTTKTLRDTLASTLLKNSVGGIQQNYSDARENAAATEAIQAGLTNTLAHTQAEPNSVAMQQETFRQGLRNLLGNSVYSPSGKEGDTVTYSMSPEGYLNRKYQMSPSNPLSTMIGGGGTVSLGNGLNLDTNLKLKVPGYGKPSPPPPKGDGKQKEQNKLVEQYKAPGLTSLIGQTLHDTYADAPLVKLLKKDKQFIGSLYRQLIGQEPSIFER